MRTVGHCGVLGHVLAVHTYQCSCSSCRERISRPPHKVMHVHDKYFILEFCPLFVGKTSIDVDGVGELSCRRA